VAYLGGFKLWECGEDLARYLGEISKLGGDDYWKNKRVIELGCGHSLPALYCMLKGASHVGFQDYVGV
jgi:predicted nicotinamide N-methyase